MVTNPFLGLSYFYESWSQHTSHAKISANIDQHCKISTDPHEFTIPPHSNKNVRWRENNIPSGHLIKIAMEPRHLYVNLFLHFQFGKGWFHGISIAMLPGAGTWIQNPSVQLPSCVRMDSTNSSHSSAERTSSNSSTGGSCGAAAVGGLSQLDCLDCHTCSLMKWHRFTAWDLNLSPGFTSFFVDGLWQYLMRTEGNRARMKVRWWFLLHGQCFRHLLHGVSWL